MRMAPKGSNIWILGPQLVELLICIALLEEACPRGLGLVFEVLKVLTISSLMLTPNPHHMLLD